MAATSSIEWTDATWNPVTGCTVVSPGCTNCYAMKLAGTRLKDHPSRAGLTQMTKAGPVWTGGVRLNEDWLDQPLRWRRPRRIFVCAHGDLFHESVPFEVIDRVFAVMALAEHHTFQVLTKRAARMRAYFEHHRAAALAADARTDLCPDAIDDAAADLTATHGGALEEVAWPLPNVWLGVSAEDQQRADERVPELIFTPAAVRFVSVYWFRDGEYTEGGDGPDRPALDWVIVGGESGANARPMYPGWVRTIRDACALAEVAFFFKQWGEWTPGENVTRHHGRVTVATRDLGRWFFDDENLADTDGHIDDEPDLYRVGKKAAGRRLDGVQHDGMPT